MSAPAARARQRAGSLSDECRRDDHREAQAEQVQGPIAALVCVAIIVAGFVVGVLVRRLSPAGPMAVTPTCGTTP